jgi:AbrB family looped-hinge helix DNA binding protein
VIVIKNFNVVKLDSKGRIIVPFHIRDYLGLKEGTELLVTNNEKRELKILPLMNGKTSEIKIMLSDLPGSMAKIVNTIARHNVDVLMSMSQTIEKGKSAEWTAMVDTSNCKDIRKLEKHLLSLDVVKKVEVEKR